MKTLHFVKWIVGILATYLIQGCSDIASSSVSPSYMQDTLSGDLLGPRLVIIPTGVGVLGDDINKRLIPKHEVVINDSYAMGIAEVTFEEYDLFCKSTGYHCPADNGWGRAKQPVIHVNWEDAVAYTRWLSVQTGHVYRLPNEVEWEYAARGGTSTQFWWGDKYLPGIDHCDSEKSHKCPIEARSLRPISAGHFKPNPFGLLDVTSNVSEWVFDCWNESHNGASTKNAKPDGTCDQRTIKGSNFYFPESKVSLAHRAGLPMDFRTQYIGFRVLRELNTQKQPQK